MLYYVTFDIFGKTTQCHLDPATVWRLAETNPTAPMLVTPSNETEETLAYKDGYVHGEAQKRGGHGWPADLVAMKKRLYKRSDDPFEFWIKGFRDGFNNN